ncbi:ribosome biogenesis protein BRX1 homolog isoform X1 [Babylonia areolata]|uniref:ribosome biogenesis protein BRX1 homolog isoform X1 n=1 Tax=Babylonia areolata TaxID=304850 RepID=UPI003FCF87F0
MAKRKRPHVGTENNSEKTSKKRKIEANGTPKSATTQKTPKPKWTNKQRVLIFSTRGIAYRSRHLMTDLRKLMAHSKQESKMDRKDQLPIINEICEMKNCNKCIFFECKKKEDLYMWISNVPRGPSVKFLVENVHTMMELKMTGNCLATSRPILSFDKEFDKLPELKLMKELFIQVFNTPRNHPKSQPFFDRVLSFTVSSNRVFVRHYQIVEEDGSLAEIGPRFVLNPIKIFEGSFGGPTLYQNPHYISPNNARRRARMVVAQKYKQRLEQKKGRVRPEVTYNMDPLDDVFATA